MCQLGYKTLWIIFTIVVKTLWIISTVVYTRSAVHALYLWHTSIVLFLLIYQIDSVGTGIQSGRDLLSFAPGPCWFQWLTMALMAHWLLCRFIGGRGHRGSSMVVMDGSPKFIMAHWWLQFFMGGSDGSFEVVCWPVAGCDGSLVVKMVHQSRVAEVNGGS